MTINISVIGLGPWGRTLANKASALPDFTLKSTYDHHDGRCLPQTEAAPSLDAILEDASIQACVITTPNDTHAAFARALLDAGKSVLVAKPLAVTSAACDDVTALARARGLVAMTGHTTLFNPGILLVKKLVLESGRPVLNFDARRRGIGRIQNNSVLLDLAVHDIANANFVSASAGFRAPRPARLWRLPAAQAQMFLRFDGGMTGHVESSWIASERRRTASVTLDGRIIELDELSATVSVYETSALARVAKDNFTAAKTAEYRIDSHNRPGGRLATSPTASATAVFPTKTPGSPVPWSTPSKSARTSAPILTGFPNPWPLHRRNRRKA